MTTLTGIEVLARLITNQPIDLGALPPNDLLARIVGLVANRNGQEPLAAFQVAIADHPDAELITRLVFEADPKSSSASPTSGPAYPELPKQARPNAELALQAGDWLDRFVKHGVAVSPMTPRLFHESGGLWLLATAIARRLKVPMSFGDIFPNVFIIWLAFTTLHHKTTALGVPRGMARDLFPHLLGTQEMTPEAFLSDLAGEEPANLDELDPSKQKRWSDGRNFAAQRSLAIDEMSGFMSSAGRDYNAGLLEAFLRFYDNEPEYERSTRGQGLVVVRNASLSLLCGSTPKAMGPHLRSDLLWDNGWWPRFGILTPEVSRPQYKRPTNERASAGDAITGPLKTLYAKLPTATWPQVPEPLTVTLGPGVFDFWEAFNRAVTYDLLCESLDERLYGTYGRLPTQVIKIATQLAAIYWACRPHERAWPPQIGLPHLHRAIQIAESWRASAHRALARSAIAEENVKLTRLQRLVDQAGPSGLTLRDIGRGMRDVAMSAVKRLVEDAVSSGELIKTEVGPGPKGGRPTQRYQVPTE